MWGLALGFYGLPVRDPKRPPWDLAWTLEGFRFQGLGFRV